MKKRERVKPVDVNKLARKIAASLFVDGGTKKKAQRLVLRDPLGRDLSGWCESAVADRIKRYLVEEL